MYINTQIMCKLTNSATVEEKNEIQIQNPIIERKKIIQKKKNNESDYYQI